MISFTPSGSLRSGRANKLNGFSITASSRSFFLEFWSWCSTTGRTQQQKPNTAHLIPGLGVQRQPQQKSRSAYELLISSRGLRPSRHLSSTQGTGHNSKEQILHIWPQALVCGAGPSKNQDRPVSWSSLLGPGHYDRYIYIYMYTYIYIFMCHNLAKVTRAQDNLGTEKN